MKSAVRIPALLLLLMLGISTIASAQLRDDAGDASQLTGKVIKDQQSETGTLANLFNMQMDHSYEMMFSSYGGQYRNINAYTNTMHFYFSDRLTGRLDLSMMHSPFGSGMMSGNSGTGVDFLIRNAEINYQLGDRSSIQLQFRQLPMNGFLPGPYYSGPFQSSFSRGAFDAGNY